jgi:multidrug resistance efflux pump
MHSNLKRIIPVLVLVLVVTTVAIWYFFFRSKAETNGALTASGTIEVVQVQIAAELGGKVAAVKVAEGQPVEAGAVLVQFDTTLLEAQRLQAAASLNAAEAGVETAQSNETAAKASAAAAQAALDSANANLALLQAGATAEQLRAAEAQVSQAAANRQALEASLTTLTANTPPEDLAAARQNLQTARTAYYGLTVVLSSDQVEAVRAALTQAETNQEQAEARQELLEDDDRTPDAALNAADLAVNEAQAAVDAAQRAYDAAQDDDLPYYRQVQAARELWDLAKFYLAQARARTDYLRQVDDITTDATDAAQATADDLQDLVDAADEAYRELSTGDLARRLDTAWKAVQDAQTALNNMGRGVSGSPSVDTLLSQIDAAAALEQAAAANLAQLQSGARPEQLTAAEAQVAAAQANLEAAAANAEATKSKTATAQAQVEAARAALIALDVQIAKLTITAPATGVILACSVEPGEVAAAGATLLVLGRMSDLTITVYVPEDRYGAIVLGQAAQVAVDSFPDETFSARVVHIAEQAEFTPRNVQTAAGRRTTVFAVKLALTDPQGRLKPGMPADVDFGK